MAPKPVSPPKSRCPWCLILRDTRVRIRPLAIILYLIDFISLFPFLSLSSNVPPLYTLISICQAFSITYRKHARAPPAWPLRRPSSASRSCQRKACRCHCNKTGHRSHAGILLIIPQPIRQVPAVSLKNNVSEGRLMSHHPYVYPQGEGAVRRLASDPWEAEPEELREQH